MNLKIAKYTLLAATVSLAACKNDDDSFSEPIKKAEGNMTFTAYFENSLSKATLNMDGNTPATSSKIRTFFEANDALSVFDGIANNKFSTTGNSVEATFSGTAKESEKGYIALFPYNSSATLNEDGTIATTIPSKQNGSKNNSLAVAYAAPQTNNFALKNATAMIGMHTKAASSSIKVEATKPITGNVKITLGQDDIPETSGATSKTVELTDATNGGFMSVMPTSGANLVVTYALSNGQTRTVYFRNVNLRRSQILDFGNLDELVTLSFDVSKISGASATDFSTKQNSKPNLPSSIGENIQFNGWIGNDGKFYTKGEVLQNITTDMSFVAVAGNEKILIFQYNGKSMFIQFKAGDKVTMPTITEAPEGKVFKGWSESPNPYKVQYEAGKEYTITVNNESMPIYAFYDVKDVKITLDANGGKFSDNTTKKEIVHKWGVSTALTPEPTLAGKWFKGWDGAANHDFKSDVTLKALWGTMSKITYKDFNGQTVKTEEYPDGGTVTINNDIQLNAMIKAWNTKQDGSGTEYIPGQKYEKLTGNITLYPIKSNQKPSTIDPWVFEEF